MRLKIAAGKCWCGWVPVLPAQPLPGGPFCASKMSLEPRFQADPSAGWFPLIQLQYRAGRAASDTIAAGLHSPDSVLQQDSLSALEDASMLQTVPGHGTKSNHTIKHTQRDEWEGPSFWCLTSSELFPNGVSACTIYRLFLCPCGLPLISPAVQFGRQRVPRRRPC